MVRVRPLDHGFDPLVQRPVQESVLLTGTNTTAEDCTNGTFRSFSSRVTTLFSFLDSRASYFLNKFAKAWRASVGAPEEVWRSTTVRAAKSSHALRAFLFTIFKGIVLLHSKRALGSK